MYAITFLCNPLLPKLDEALITPYIEALKGDSITWLGDGVAAEIYVKTRPRNIKKIWMELQKLKIDIVFQQNHMRKKKLLVADMDSTIINQECLDELADEAGYGEEIKKITRKAMDGDLHFEAALLERVKYLKGIPEKTIDQVLKNRIHLAAGAKTLISTMKKNESYTALVSGGFTHFTSKIAKDLGFHENVANQLEIKNCQLTGNVKLPILGKDAKVTVLKSLINRLNLSLSDTISVGDGANDIGMLRLAGLGVALHAKNIVQAEADIIINHCDLTSLLYIQGYHQDEFLH